MTQATPAAGRAPARGAKAGATASAGPRLLKLLVAVALVPVALILLTALCDLNLAGLIWNHPAAPLAGGNALNWHALTRSLPGLIGLGLLGLTLGLWWKPLTRPEWWLKRYAGRLLGAAAQPGESGDAGGSFLGRWLLFEMPLMTLLGWGVQALFRELGQTVVADAILAAVPFVYGIYFAGLLQMSTLDGELCKEDGFLFTWVSTLVLQLFWVVVGVVCLLQARPVLSFILAWLEAGVVRAARWSKWS